MSALRQNGLGYPCLGQRPAGGGRAAEPLWCVEFGMLYPDDSGGWPAERCRSFAVLRFSGYLHGKPSGAWALLANTDGTCRWAPVQGARIGPKMRAIRDAVSAMPGCAKEEAVQAVDGYMPSSGRYRPLDRALRAGLIVADRPGRERVRLFASGAARRIWYLRRELREPGLPSRAARSHPRRDRRAAGRAGPDVDGRAETGYRRQVVHQQAAAGQCHDQTYTCL
jgi:hypothetical protein